uniref:Carboxylic ester hydrolase (EC) n=1 Tax=Ganoderma boninense TaxID=34458 RepID=A0A5K1K4C6_9APHY|nr:Carboxylic ester hydrolase (EC [Ganoderma boninense]
MPSSRHPRARVRASARVSEPTRQCQALLADEETRCSLRFQGRRGNYCPAHGREYGELTGAYKDASNRVDALEPEMRKARMGAVVLCTVADVDAAIALANRYLEAMGDEIGGRETHHKRFFREADENHGKWLKHRRGEQQAAMCLLERLQRRREEVVAVEAAARRSAEWRKAIEERYAAAEAQRKATEEARRKAAQSAGISTIEDQRRAIAELQRREAAARNILGERTNAVAAGSMSTQRSAAPNSNQVEVPGTRRVPPGYWPPIDPPRHLPAPPPRYPQPQPQPRPQPPQRIEQHPSAARETQPLLRPAGVPRGTVFIPPANSWVCDIESQSHSAGRLRARVFQAAPRLRNEESIDCGCSKMLFCAVSLFVFCHLVVLAYIWNGHH